MPTPHETREGSNPNRAEAFGSPGPAARSSRSGLGVSEPGQRRCAGRPVARDTGLARAALGSLPTRREEPGVLAQRGEHVNGEGFPGN